MFDYSRGSEWNKWDLHLHTASSYDYKYKGKDADELLCKTLIENNIKAVAITDHFTIDPNRIENLRKLSPEIVFFPGVELRTDKGANNLHVILIFSEQSNIFELASDFDAIMIRNEAKSREDNQRIYWNFETIIDFAKKHDALVTIHAGNKTNGIDKEITSALPVKDAIKEEIASNIHFFEIGKIKDKDEYDNIVFKEIDVKPLIICSDCHNPKDYKTNENLWIKADLTFIGLKQCLYQPKERVYIGLIPPLLDRYNKNKSNIIDNISINRVDKPKNDTVKWFDVNLPLNSGMIAIIGNKGSGKSALTDIIGHLNRCHTMESASFLNDGRFKKPPTKYANDYEGCLKWADGKTTKLNLDIKNNEETIEDAFYLPQAHIENICNDIDNKFQKEINEVIFGYIDVTERGISHKLDELINEKSRQVGIKIQNKIDKLHVINDIIIQLENKKTEKYKSLINEKIKKIEETLCRHEKQKPIEIKKPTQTNNMEYVSKLNELNKQIEIIKNSIETKKVELINVNEFLETANNLIVEISDIENQFNIIRLHVNYFFNKYNLDISDNKFVINTPKEFLNNLLNFPTLILD